MVLDAQSESSRYVSLHPRFSQAFAFLARADLPTIAPGRHAIDGDLLYVSIDLKEGRDRSGARLETHRKYIDIQFTMEGDEQIGWMPRALCTQPAGAFDVAKDIVFYDDRPTTWLSVPPGRFAIFFPEDAHAPLAGRGMLKKAIVKIAV